MSDAISRRAAMNSLSRVFGIPLDYDGNCDEMCDEAFAAIEALPALDVVPEVHARWIYSGDMDSDGNSQGYCSRCGAGDKHRADLKNLVPYCWKCGARMDAEEKPDAD